MARCDRTTDACQGARKLYATAMPTTDDRPVLALDAIRAELPVLDDYVYLNSGTAGPLPRRAARAMTEALEHELSAGRGNFAAFDAYFALLSGCRSLCARLLGAESQEIALTHHTSEGVGIVLTAFDWAPGDRILTTTLEHDAITVPLGLLRERYGVQPEFVDIGMGEAVLDRLDARALEGVRLVALSHVVFSSGATLPLGEIAQRCRAAGVPLLVDGAQTCGARPLDVRALGVDFYTLSGQKWICGPEGTGALYVRKDWIERLRPSRGSYFSAKQHDFRGNVTLHADARRFETAIAHPPSWAGFSASAQWILDEVGLDHAWQHAQRLTQLARERLGELPGVSFITPAELPSQLLTFTMASIPVEQLERVMLRLARESRIVIRTTPTAPRALRASFGFFNNEDDIERLVTALAEFGGAR
jgi:L-cysteine/cystine lyase